MAQTLTLGRSRYDWCLPRFGPMGSEYHLVPPGGPINRMEERTAVCGQTGPVYGWITTENGIWASQRFGLCPDCLWTAYTEL